jgi:hypothetical protein
MCGVRELKKLNASTIAMSLPSSPGLDLTRLRNAIAQQIDTGLRGQNAMSLVLVVA